MVIWAHQQACDVGQFEHDHVAQQHLARATARLNRDTCANLRIDSPQVVKKRQSCESSRLNLVCACTRLVGNNLPAKTEVTCYRQPATVTAMA